MHIQWCGQSCFKLQTKDTIVIINPYDKECGLTPLRTRADIVLASNSNKENNNIDSLKDDPFVIDGPGEYERMGVTVKGITSHQDNKEGQEQGLNIIYIVNIEGIRICHLGNLGHTLTPKQVERINGVDILLAPVGASNISLNKIIDVIGEIEPRMVIPMHYSIPKVKEKLVPVDKFLAEMGAKKETALPKLVIKKKDLPTEETSIKLLDYSR
ncbi:MAG: MBL fold metallo-hydrolase [Parcubacteria group bacterium]|nr:MBL fold metallo-hydrolase [Parcubacteria group bacterium]